MDKLETVDRYSRHTLLKEVGEKGQQQLLNAKVLVIGAGGLGCPALQYLAGAGIGEIGIVDYDIVSVSNLQRQVLYGNSSIGKLKSLAARERLQDLNDTIKIVAYPEKLTHRNAITLFQQYDIIVDGTDNFESRYLINDASLITNKPMVYGAIHKFEGQVSVFNHKNGPSYRCVFPTPPKKNEVPNCSEIGVLGVLPGIIGTMQAAEVIKIILGFTTVLSGKICHYNAITNQTTLIQVNRSEREIKKVISESKIFSDTISVNHCENSISERDVISLHEVNKMKKVHFIDVRELTEQPFIVNSSVTQLPLSELEKNINRVDNEKTNILFCKIGVRSKHALHILKKYNIKNCYSLIEGAADLRNYLDKDNKL